MSHLRGRICIFTGSNRGIRSEYADAARGLARQLVERGYGLVYGGGNRQADGCDCRRAGARAAM
jgi:predicted Rossmann-fold nucleotide-binding protein